MDEGLKKRLVGATVLVSLVVIFVPMLLEQDPVINRGITGSNIPLGPGTDFTSRVLPLQNENLALPPASGDQPVAPETASSPSAPEQPSATASSQENQPPAKPETAVEPRVGLSAWVIQVGSFSMRENAERVEQQLKEKKFPAFIEQVGVKGRALFRVKVGPEVDRELAEEMLARVNQELVSLKLKGKLTSYQ